MIATSLNPLSEEDDIHGSDEENDEDMEGDDSNGEDNDDDNVMEDDDTLNAELNSKGYIESDRSTRRLWEPCLDPQT